MTDGAARVIQALRSAQAPCSGESLSAELGVSRAQIWKHIEKLRKRGYEIEGRAGGGYALSASPDRLYPEELGAGLDTKWLAREVVHFDEIDSTNREALERGRSGAAHGTVVVAEAQTAGRGRLGRSFYSPANANLYTSIVLRPRIDIGQAPTLIPTSAIAVAECVAEFCDAPDAVEIKWPNDVLLGGRKTSGILMEMSTEATQVGFLVLGIGVNLNVDREQFPDEFRAHATSLCSFRGAPVDRAAFARRLYSILEPLLDAHEQNGFESVRPRFDALFRMPGRRVRVVETARDTSFEGTAAGIARDGALRVALDDGSIREVVAGDVTLAKVTQEEGAAR